MKPIYAPDDFRDATRTVFLAGSIEMGATVDWQRQIMDFLSDCDATILNPRRPDWDASWQQTTENAAFVKQVNWELDALHFADCIVYYFDPQTKAPVSLLELGLFADSGKIAVCCPSGFWRKGNVDVVCQKFGVPIVETIAQLAEFARRNLQLS